MRGSAGGSGGSGGGGGGGQWLVGEYALAGIGFKGLPDEEFGTPHGRLSNGTRPI